MKKLKTDFELRFSKRKAGILMKKADIKKLTAAFVFKGTRANIFITSKAPKSPDTGNIKKKKPGTTFKTRFLRARKEILIRVRFKIFRSTLVHLKLMIETINPQG